MELKSRLKEGTAYCLAVKAICHVLLEDRDKGFVGLDLYECLNSFFNFPVNSRKLGSG